MTRQTSEAAFAYLVDGEHLARSQRGIYAALYVYGPLTASELRDVVAKGSAGDGIFGFVGLMEQCNITKRLSELSRQGLVVALGTRECAITKREVIVWDVTGAERPVPIEPRGIVPRLSKDEFSAAAEEIEGFTQGEPISPTLRKVIDWLKRRAE